MESTTAAWIEVAVPGEYPHNWLHLMRLAALGFACAPMALLTIGALDSKAYPAYPMGGYSESITCAATTTNLELREALGCPSYAHAAWSHRVITGQEAVTSDAMGNDWVLRKWLESPVR